MLSFLAFMGHLPCCGWSLMDHFALRSLTISYFFAATLNGREQGTLPFSVWLSSLPECQAFANLSDSSEHYGKEISKPWWCPGFHSLKQVVCGEIKFSSSPIYGGDYIPILMSTYSLIEDKSQEGEDVY